MTQRVSELALVLAGVVSALVIALWPLHADGVSGNAIAPRYHAFGWFAVDQAQPLPEHPTLADLRRAGVHLPQDAVEQRRRLAASLAAAGLMLGLTATLAAEVRRGSRARRAANAPTYLC